MSLIQRTDVEDIAFLEMQNPTKLNCLSEELCNDLMSEILLAYADKMKAIVIKAQCRSNVWSAGHDIRELPLDKQDPLSYKVPMEQLLRAIQDVAIPVIAYIDGTVWGGACDLCLSCDMIVASDNATFAITPAKIGIPYNASGIMHFINQLGINKAREMFFTAAPLTAAEALNVGLVNHVATQDKLMDVLNERILNPIRRNSIVAISAMKRQFRILSQSMSNLSPEQFEQIESWRTAVYNGDDYQEGIKSFLEKRPAKYSGSALDLELEKDPQQLLRSYSKKYLK